MDGQLAPFSARLREIIQNSDMTYADLNRYLHLSPGTASNWRNNLPRAEHLPGIAEYFGVTIDWLMGVEDAPQWSGAVQKRIRRYQALMASAPDQPLSTPTQRLAYALGVWRQLEGADRADRLLALRLGVSQKALLQMYAGVVDAGEAVLQRFADFSGIPLSWFLTGEGLAPLQVQGIQEYVPAILTLKSAGISPDDLSAHTPLLIQVHQHMRRLLGHA